MMRRALRGLLFVLCVAPLACGSDRSRAPASTPAGAEPSTGTVEPRATGREEAVAPVSLAAGLPRIVFLGDSLTAGYGLAKEQSVPSLIEARLRREGYEYDVVNAGVSGDTSAGGLSRLEWSLQGPVRVLVVELGGNDGLRGLPIAALRENLDQVIRRAKARGIAVLLTGMEAPPNFGPAYTTEFRAVFSGLAAEHKVAFVPFYLEGVAGNPALNIADGIHPNPAGARIVHETIWRALRPLLGAGRQGGDDR